jgi:energy-coupling factor transport system ATP-binding protein
MNGGARPVLSVRGLTYAWPRSERPVLRSANLSIGRGECHCLVGPTGCGKTTLLRAIRDLLPEGERRGEIQVRAGGVGLVLQNPETQLLAPTVGSEAAFGLENRAVPPAEMAERVSRALADVGLEKPWETPVDALSMGQKYRLILAGHLAMAPDLLLLDEPAAQLDRPGLDRLAETIRRLKDRGVAFLLCEHDPEPLAEVIDGWWRMDAQGRVIPSGPLGRRRTAAFASVRTGTGNFAAGNSGLATGSSTDPQIDQFTDSPKNWKIAVKSSVSAPGSRRKENSGKDGNLPSAGGESSPPILTARDAAVAGEDDAPVWSGADFSIERGGRYLVSGPNGAGKTTLLRAMVGFRPLSAGELRIFGARPRPADLRGRVGLLHQNPARQLFEETVRGELAFSLCRFGGEEESGERVAAALDHCGIRDLADHSPHTLSFGQKHLVALATLLAWAPPLLLLDDPFAGLDPEMTGRVASALDRLNRERGTTIVWTAHRPDRLAGWADAGLQVENGRIVPTTG